MQSLLPAEDEFMDAVNKVFSPSGPVRRAEMLKGRNTELRDIEEALSVRGRVAFVFGSRGVGKTSLALTGAALFAPEGQILLASCDERQTTLQLAREIAAEILGVDPLTSAGDKKLGFNVGVLSGESSAGKIGVPEPHSINEAAKILDAVLRKKQASFESGAVPVVVVDEFDRLGSTEERQLVGDLLKQVGDRNLPIRLIFCGVARSLDELFEGHASAYRYIGSVELEPLSLEGRLDILRTGESALGVHFTKDQQFRIAEISDGFPYYVHLVGETVTKAHYYRCQEYACKEWPFEFGTVTTDDFNVGVERAIVQCQGHLKAMYNKATKKYAPLRDGGVTVTDYELILWAAAAQPTFERPGSAIFTEYQKLRQLLGLKSASLLEPDEDEVDDEMTSETAEAGDDERIRFNQRITRLKKPSHGGVLNNPRRAWWEFSEPMLRGYCRLVAKRHGFDLGAEISSRL